MLLVLIIIDDFKLPPLYVGCGSVDERLNISITEIQV